jgi:hypothetical protein
LEAVGLVEPAQTIANAAIRPCQIDQASQALAPVIHRVHSPTETFRRQYRLAANRAHTRDTVTRS